MTTDTKIKITPNNIYIQIYEKYLEYGYRHSRKRKKRDKERRKTSYENYLSFNRIRRRIKEIIECNTPAEIFNTARAFRPVFVTLTFKRDVTSIGEANGAFRTFVKLLNQDINRHSLLNTNYRLEYVVVPEIQEKRKKTTGLGVWHFHIIFFNFPKKDNTNKYIAKYWKHGFNYNNTLKNSDHVANYVTKYFTKGHEENFEKYKKHYFCSKGLKKATILMDENSNKQILSVLEKPTYQKIGYDWQGQKIINLAYKNNPLSALLYKDQEDKIIKKTVDNQPKMEIKPVQQKMELTNIHKA